MKKEISKKLESLYGAKFDCGISKKGDIHVIRFYGEIINQNFIVFLKIFDIFK